MGEVKMVTRHIGLSSTCCGSVANDGERRGGAAGQATVWLGCVRRAMTPGGPARPQGRIGSDATMLVLVKMKTCCTREWAEIAGGVKWAATMLFNFIFKNFSLKPKVLNIIN
jgi:hypothetical protein